MFSETWLLISLALVTFQSLILLYLAYCLWRTERSLVLALSTIRRLKTEFEAWGRFFRDLKGRVTMPFSTGGKER